jgi:MFS family permease
MCQHVVSIPSSAHVPAFGPPAAGQPAGPGTVLRSMLLAWRDGDEAAERGADPSTPRRTLSAAERQRHRLIINLSGGLSGFQWQAFVPSLPLMLVNGLAEPPSAVGTVYLVFILAATVSYLFLPKLLQHLSAYQVLQHSFELRGLSGLVHVATLSLCKGSSLCMPLLLLSRLIHGATLLLVPLAVVWIGVNVPDAEKPGALAERNMFSAGGVALGLLSGALLTAAFPDPIAGGVAPGVLLVISSAAMWAWLGHSFTDRRMLEQKRPTPSSTAANGEVAPPPPEEEEVPWTHVILVGFANFFGWAGYLTTEGTLSLVLVQALGFRVESTFFGWVPTALAIFAGTLAFARFQAQGWTATALTQLAAGSLALALGSILVLETWYGEGRPAATRRCSPSAFFWYVFGTCAVLFAFAVSNTLANAQLLLWLPSHMQARFQSPVQLLATLGRALGPSIGALIAQTSGDGLYDVPILSTSLVLVALAALVPAAFGDRFLAPPAGTTASGALDDEAGADYSPGFDDRQMSFVRRSRSGAPIRATRHTISSDYDYDAQRKEAQAAPTCHSARVQKDVHVSARALA